MLMWPKPKGSGRVPGRLGQKVPSAAGLAWEQNILYIWFGFRVRHVLFFFFLAFDGDHMWYVAMSCRFFREPDALYLCRILL